MLINLNADQLKALKQEHLSSVIQDKEGMKPKRNLITFRSEFIYLMVILYSQLIMM